jgi:hypothetical protein
LNVDHVPHTEIALIVTHYFGKLQKTRIGLPGRLRVIERDITLAVWKL